MKRTIAIAIVLYGMCSASFAVVFFMLDAPQDDRMARRGVHDRPELKPLDAAYSELVQTRFWPLKLDNITKVFGPKIETVANRYGTGLKHPANLVLPVLVPDGMGLSGLGGDPARDKYHTDLHVIGDIGYVAFYYQADGESLQTAVVYFRADDKFVPLKSTNDFSKRLEWDKARFTALKKWLDEHLPKKTTDGH